MENVRIVAIESIYFVIIFEFFTADTAFCHFFCLFRCVFIFLSPLRQPAKCILVFLSGDLIVHPLLSLGRIIHLVFSPIEYDAYETAIARV